MCAVNFFIENGVWWEKKSNKSGGWCEKLKENDVWWEKKTLRKSGVVEQNWCESDERWWKMDVWWRKLMVKWCVMRKPPVFSITHHWLSGMWWGRVVENTGRKMCVVRNKLCDGMENWMWWRKCWWVAGKIFPLTMLFVQSSLQFKVLKYRLFGHSWFKVDRLE